MLEGTHAKYLTHYIGDCRKPVYVVGAERCTWKLVEFHEKLRERGLVRPFTGLEDVSD